MSDHFKDLISPDTLHANMEDIQESIGESERRKTSHWVADQLARQIETFELNLDEEHEVGVRLASFGGTIQIYFDSIRSIAPNMIVLGGTTDTGEPATLFQHMNQLNVLLVALKKRGPKLNRIGFVHHGGDQD